jgi:hypothetical protein
VLISRATETIFAGIEPRTVCRRIGPCSCNLFFEINKFDLGAVLLSCLVSELQETPSPEIELRTYFSELLQSHVLFLISRNKHAKFGANRYIRSRAISEQTHKQMLYNYRRCKSLELFNNIRIIFGVPSVLSDLTGFRGKITEVWETLRQK